MCFNYLSPYMENSSRAKEKGCREYILFIPPVHSKLLFLYTSTPPAKYLYASNKHEKILDYFATLL